MSQNDFEALCKDAVRYRYCFNHFGVRPPAINIAQPRWIGPRFWDAKLRLLVVMLNPGSGDFRIDSADSRLRDLLRSFADETGELQTCLDHQLRDMPNWGRGRFSQFYVTGLGLDLQRTAFANVAWCATQGNQYPRQILKACFTRFTERLLKILQPQIVLLSGAETHRFAGAIEALIPQAVVIPTLHYAHRKGQEAKQEEVQRVTDLIARLSY